MLWQFQIILAWLASAQGVNSLFVLVCLAAALGADPRSVALISALLYLRLVLAG